MPSLSGEESTPDTRRGRGEDVDEDVGFQGGGFVLGPGGDHPAVVGGELAAGDEVAGLRVRVRMEWDDSAG